MSDPTNVNELMVQAAQALNDRDEDRLIELANISGDWLQDREARDAQQEMLWAMIAAFEDME